MRLKRGSITITIWQFRLAWSSCLPPILNNSRIWQRDNALVYLHDGIRITYCNCIPFAILHTNSGHALFFGAETIDESHKVRPGPVTSRSGIIPISFFSNLQTWIRLDMPWSKLVVAPNGRSTLSSTASIPPGWLFQMVLTLDGNLIDLAHYCL